MIRKVFFFFSCYFAGVCASDLDYLICPEIIQDEFYNIIVELSGRESMKTVLEIGSSSGEGSTEAFVLGMQKNPCRPTLFCMEISKPRFDALQRRYEDLPWVKCYNVSSVSIKDFPSEKELRSFIRHPPIPLKSGISEMGIRWLRQDIKYLKRSGVPQNGIEIIKRENYIKTFDMVLIDGSEFTGKPELERVYGAKWILLDDTRSFKNYYNYVRLLNDPQYELYQENSELRFGYAVFKRII